MPTIDIEVAEFEKLLGRRYGGDIEKLDDALAFVKAEVKLYNRAEDTLSIEMKDTNRPDLWSAEGLARGLRCYLNIDRGMREYHATAPMAEVHVDPRLRNIRPYICCSIVKDVRLTDVTIRGLMHLQDKLDQTYGRNRQKTSIGIYDYSLITMPLSYTVTKPEDISFVPLGFEEKMNLAEILERHPKGQEYGHIVKKYSVYPILLDAKRKVLSFPPIINSNDLGRVTEDTKHLLVEVTGTLHQTVLNTLNLVTMALVDRGGKACSTTVHYQGRESPIVTPDFRSKRVPLSVDFANHILGLQLTGERMAELLTTAGFGIENATDESVVALVPCYRTDIMHPVDLVEDVAVAYGYNNIEMCWRELPTTGAARPEQHAVDTARELMIGAGYQEILTYTLTNPENLFAKMGCQAMPTIEVANPKVVTMTCLRSWLLPSLMEFLSNNQSVEFPQRIFELGRVTIPDNASETRARDEEWLAVVTAHPNAGFSEIKAVLDTFLTNLGLAWQIQPTDHPSFIEGRAGSATVNGVRIGVLGEVSPRVLEAWKLENPVAAFEISIQAVIDLWRGKV
ncbi:MAG: phenylalanine--tRNA ligase subunit beta [Candidatus Bathyarchaeia archaeon]